MEFPRIASPDPKLGSISSLRCQKSRMPRPVKDTACEVMFSRTKCFGVALASIVSPSSPKWATPGTLRPSSCVAAPRVARRAKRGGARRDRTDDLMLAKHALSQLSYGPVPEDECFPSIVETPLFREKPHSIKVVGLGRLELPTSRLSSARSNQLSYKPLTRGTG